MPKKEGSEKMSDRDIKIKSDILQELMQFAQEQMGKRVKDGMDEMQKVTVAAPSSDGLHEGLEKALEMVPEMQEEAEDMKEEASPVEKMMEEKSAEPMESEEDEDSYYTKGPKLQFDEDEDSMFNKKMKMKK